MLQAGSVFGIQRLIKPYSVLTGCWQDWFVKDVETNAMIWKLRLVLSARLVSDSLSRPKTMIASGPKILIHVRKGDYAYTTGYNVLGSEYYIAGYLKLLQEMRLSVDTPVYLVSDDLDYALNLLKDFVPSLIPLVLCDPLDVLAELASADARIIANSTLSLWGC